MTTSNDRWGELAFSGTKSAGVTRLRVAPESRHDLFIGVIQPGARRCFWYDVPETSIPQDYRLPVLRSIRVTVRALPDRPAITRIELELENPDLGEVFRAMVNDLVAAIAAADDDDRGLSALADRLERWRRLLQTDGRGGLTTSERRGLFGELTLLAQLLDTGIASGRAIGSWTGPFGHHQDFQADRAAIEVKSTSAKQPQSLIIASERELDDTGVEHLFLVHLSLDERQGGTGQSLNALVEAVGSRLTYDSVAQASFRDALLQLGYLSEQADLYDTPRYTLRGQSCYEVADGFPRLTEQGVPIGVGDVTYRVQLSALQPFAVELNHVLANMGAA